MFGTAITPDRGDTRPLLKTLLIGAGSLFVVAGWSASAPAITNELAEFRLGEQLAVQEYWQRHTNPPENSQSTAGVGSKPAASNFRSGFMAQAGRLVARYGWLPIMSGVAYLATPTLNYMLLDAPGSVSSSGQIVGDDYVPYTPDAQLLAVRYTMHRWLTYLGFQLLSDRRIPFQFTDKSDCTCNWVAKDGLKVNWLDGGLVSDLVSGPSSKVIGRIAGRLGGNHITLLVRLSYPVEQKEGETHVVTREAVIATTEELASELLNKRSGSVTPATNPVLTSVAYSYF